MDRTANVSKAQEALFGWDMLAALATYAVLLAAYVLFVLRLLAEPLRWLRENHEPIYSLAALALIVAQAVALEFVAAWVLRRFRQWRRGPRGKG